MALLQSTTISGSNANTGSLSITGSTMIFPVIESSLTSSFSGSGKMWVNADGMALQYTVQTSLGTVQSPASFMGAWSTGGSMNIARAHGAGTGVTNAGLAMGGYSPTIQNATEEYDGSSWATGGNMITAIYSTAAAGTQNAGIQFGGYYGAPDYRTCTEEYNGSAWASGGALITARGGSAGMGFQDATLNTGGTNIAGKKTCTEAYNGSAWAAGGALIDARAFFRGSGTQNAALSISGYNPAMLTRNESYDGVSHSEINPVNTARYSGHVAGTQNATVFFGGNTSPNNVGCTEEWNGISWVQGCNMSVARAAGMGGGSLQSSTFIGGGATPTKVATTEEYVKNSIPPYTACVWTSGAGMIVPRSGGAGGGTKNAGFAVAGLNPSRVSCMEEWDGNQWSVGGALIITRSALAGGGTLNAGWAAGGEPAGGTSTEHYNGTSWSSANALASGGYGKRGGGPRTAAQVVNGTPSRDGNQTYDGTTWSNATSMPTQRGASALTGTCAASIVYGGSDVSGNYLNYGITWNGSSWSQTGATNTCARGNQMGGTQNDALSYGGYNPANPNQQYFSEHYDGSAWSVQGNLSVASKYGQGAATSPSAATDSFYAGGYHSPAVIGNMQLFNAGECSSTLCSSLPVWSGADALSIGRQYVGGAGTTSAGLVFGGNTSPSTSTCTEEYDGSTWSGGGALINPIANHSGVGTQTAALSIGGYAPGGPHPDAPGTIGKTEEYNGSTWAAGGTLNQVIFEGEATGTQNAAIASHGRGAAPSYSNLTCTQEYDGSTWTAGGNVIYARSNSVATGTQNAALSVGGDRKTCVEEYNGSAWSTGGTLIIAGNSQGSAGLQYDSVVFGGDCYPGSVTNLKFTQNYDGSSWSYGPNMGIAKRQMAINCTGTANSAFAAGGRTSSPSSTDTQLYNNVVSTCVGAWSAGPNTSVTGTRELGFGAVGTQNAFALFSGRISPSNITCTEEYDGSSWSLGGANITARYIGSNAGTQNAGILVGGNDAAGTCLSCTEEYNGSSWASGTANPRGADFLTSTGTQNAAVTFGGRASSPSIAHFKCNQHYDGTSWTAKNSLSTGRYASGGVGTQNAGLAFGGYCSNPPNGYQVGCDNTEEFDGTNWSSKQNLLFAVGAGNSAGTANDALMIGGYIYPALRSYNQSWDGTAWSTTQSLLGKTARLGSGGSGNAAIAAKGYGGMNTALWNVNQVGAGLQNWIGKVDFVTE